MWYWVSRSKGAEDGRWLSCPFGCGVEGAEAGAPASVVGPILFGEQEGLVPH